jgi:hypothetical protein
MLKAEVPTFVNVTTWAELVCFSRTLPKSTLAGTSFTVPVVSVIDAAAVLDALLSEAAVSVNAVLFGRLAGAV